MGSAETEERKGKNEPEAFFFHMPSSWGVISGSGNRGEIVRE